MNKKILILFCLLLLPGLCIAEGEHNIVVGEIFTLEVNNIEKVFIRKPEILDIVKAYDDRVELIGKKEGFTEVVIEDKLKNKHIYQIEVLSENLDILAQKVRDLIYRRLGIEEVIVKKDTLNSKIILEGELPQAKLERVGRAIEQYSGRIENYLMPKVERDLVQIDVEVLELTKSMADNIGFDWPGTAGSNPTEAVKLTGTAGSGSWSEVFRVVDWTRASFDLKINAAIERGKGKILARPKLVCLSGEEANFLVGGEIPVVTVTSTAGGDTIAEDVEYKEFGVKLNIRPQLVDEDSVRLYLNTQVKELSSDGQYTRSDGTVIKAFATRQASTVLQLREGQGVVISGLLKDKVAKDDISKVPGLGDIPILGALFRSKDYQEDQTELVISLVPKIIRHKAKKERLARLAENYRPLTRKDDGISLVLAGYIKMVQDKVYNALVYPPMAKSAGWQGTVKLSLHLASNGTLLAARIADSSGYHVFDDAAVKIAKDISPYPSFPLSLEENELWIDIPIRYELD